MIMGRTKRLSSPFIKSEEILHYKRPLFVWLVFWLLRSIY